MANTLKGMKYGEKVVSFIIMIILFLAFAGCNGLQDQQKGDEDMNVIFQTGEYYDKEWDGEIGTYQGDVIPSKEIAVKVAVQIFEGMQKSSKAQDYAPQSVFYDEQDKVWIVFFGESFDEGTAGGGCSIAIQKKDGKVLRIWYGE